ncbi:succinyl-diaminopimelate desuccinylase [Leptolyngbya sp. 15MV]|nr:succinyl-diaminopimelate desuccinylase [Leptolyngbya sp. 15MV]
MTDPIPLAQALIRRKSVTPADDGALDVVQRALEPLGFACTRLVFGPDDYRVDNLFARRGTGAPHLCYAGHTDVVPPGDVAAWSDDPFSGTVKDGRLYGRGACDMKGGVAAFIAGVTDFLAANPDHKGSISLLITGDEEARSVDGTARVLEWMQANGQIPDMALVGEPTSRRQLGDTIKIGRRGSLTCWITVHGRQGHSAYPAGADNPIHKLLAALAPLLATPLDNGSAHFPPSTFQVTGFDVGNPVHAALLVLVLHVLGVDGADAQAQRVEVGRGPVAVALDEVVVDGDDVDLLALDGGEVAGERGDDGLALAGLHLGDLALGEDHAADELHVEGPGAEWRPGLRVDLSNGVVDLVGDLDLHPTRDLDGPAEPWAFGLGGGHGVGLCSDLVVERADALGEESGVEAALWIEDVANAHGTVHGLPGDGEGLDENVVDAFALLDALAELVEHASELGVGHGSDAGLEGVDGADALGVSADEALVSGADDALEDGADDGDACVGHDVVLRASCARLAACGVCARPVMVFGWDGNGWSVRRRRDVRRCRAIRRERGAAGSAARHGREGKAAVRTAGALCRC